MNIEYRVNPSLTNAELNVLYMVSWPSHPAEYDFSHELSHALAVIGAYKNAELVGCVRLAWDGGIHAFLLEPTVHPHFRRRGIGRTLVERAVAVARDQGMQWVHVDYEPQLHPFYEACGFIPTKAGLFRLT